MPRRYWLIKSEPFKYAWGELVVDVEPVVSVGRPVTLQEIKADPALRNIDLVRRSHLRSM